MSCLFRTCWVIDMEFIFVEGPDDERYIKRILSPLIGECNIVEYSTLTQKKINQFIQSVDCMASCDYIFLGDADGKTIEERKLCLLEKYQSLSPEKTFVVQYEIESWYYAGVTEAEAKKMKLKHFVLKTDMLTKENFYSKISRMSEKRIIMDNMLEVYSLEYAVTRNDSLKRLLSYIKKERTLSAVY